MKVLVTGGSGYFGELLTKKLLQRGYDCSILDINKPDSSIIDEIDYFQCDIRDYEKVLNSCQNIDVVFHNVAQVPLAKNNELFKTVNYDGTKNILRASVNQEVKKFVYTSTSAIFGVPESNPVDEDTPPSPAEEYGKAKLDGEKLSLKQSSDALEVSVIRPRTILGHGRLGIFQILFEWVYKGYNIPVFDKGTNIYQFIHADDLAEACILASEKDRGGIYNIGTDEFSSMYETLNQLVQYADTGSEIRSLPSKLVVPVMKLASSLGLSPLGAYHALMYGKSLYFDVSKAKNELGWQPEYSNKKMMIDSYDWYVKNRESILNSTDQDEKSHHKSAIKQGVLSLVGRFL